MGDECFITEESKSVQEVATSSLESDYVEELVELQSRFICLQYEFQYNLDKISDLDYEHRYRNPEYITYQSNATSEVKRIEEENKRILNKAGCRSESELYTKQQAYDKNYSIS